ncbi:SRPBCC domain-containing protein [Leifsonia virtsii]|uniref:SRPBCC domain-containing protein n=1 Tax=Leifsonia virtsii TaxID=3035915 RepID=A0ABT8J037_9MICO|nr:SRPBCC domain-containing protein [Leifsonia virtsii]MDN4598258.1 SRPBCC domain-containing protein [Leifsonia virtsii]
MDVQQALATIGEPTRFRILSLLAAGPRTVGEVAAAIGALQPQTTKHLQLLETVGVVSIERLGRRRLARVDRNALRELADWLGGLATATSHDDALQQYAAAVRSAGAAADIVLERTLTAPPDAVWRAWTDAREAARWWAPRHFEVVCCAVSPQPGAPVELVLREADGAEYASAGTVRSAEPGRRIVFDLSPVDANGRAYFEVVVDAALEPSGGGTALRAHITAEGADADTAPMLAGLEPGWSQQLDRLEEVLG